MDSLRFADALAAYSAAYEIEKEPALLYDRGRASQLLGDYPEALARFEEFEASAPADLLARVAGLPQVMADLRARVTSLVIVCDVRGVQIRVRDKVLGAAPLAGTIRVNAGKGVSFEASADGYYTLHRAVDLPPGGTAMVDMTPKSKQRYGVLVLRSPTVGAVASIDDRAVGTVPLEELLPAGAHKVSLRRDGYVPVDSSVVIGAGDRREVTLSLETEPTLVSKWWFWAGVGAAVVAGVALTAAALTDRAPDNGSIAPGHVAAGLLRF
jgi:hypothetical protein